MSLLLRRPPGREAYPGDVFYLHSRLLERAARLNEKFGGGSITALPIIETLAGDISAYIPTNVISITDGQIFLESDLFFSGQRPAINTGLSVSRVGGAAQIKAIKKIGSKLKLSLAQYRDLAGFAQFGSELDEETRKSLQLGERMMRILRQRQNSPLEVWQQIVMLFAVTEGLLSDIPVERISDFEGEFLNYFEINHSQVYDDIQETSVISDENKEIISQAVTEFAKTFQ